MNKKDTAAIQSSVVTSIKKEGTFDIVRKKAVEQFKSTEFMAQMEAEIKREVDKLINEAPTNSTKEALRNTIRKLITDIITRSDLQKQISNVVSTNYVKSMLEEAVKRKVSKECGYTENGDLMEEHIDVNN